MFNSVDDAFNWMVSFTNLEKKPDLTKRGYRLDKMVELLKLFNNPHKAYKIIHVAGSKGKGSTCGFLSSILTEAGYKTGVYSSPHLLDFRERVTCNHNFFEKQSYLSAIGKIHTTLSGINIEAFPGGEPTTFELMTLAAFIIFKEEKCEWVVLETGLGGLLDSTNVVIPEISVITPIELEHTDLLGDTIGKIALEKAGIIKPGVTVITSNSGDAPLKVIESRASDLNSKFIKLDRGFATSVDKNGTRLIINNDEYKIGLEGAIQGENALLALSAIKEVLPNISQNSIEKGLSRCSIPGRFQKINNHPVIVDGAHTEQSIKWTTKTFNRIYGKGTLIFGALNGKNIDSMIEYIGKYFDDIIVSTPGTFKESNPEMVAELFKEKGLKATLIPSPSEALKCGIKRGDPILVTGSFYMAGEIAKVIKDNG